MICQTCLCLDPGCCALALIICGCLPFLTFRCSSKAEDQTHTVVGCEPTAALGCVMGMIQKLAESRHTLPSFVPTHLASFQLQSVIMILD